MSLPYAEVIGDPIAHSKSPLIHNFWLEKLGILAEYRACHVRHAELADYFKQRRADSNWQGCNVTIPHKQDVIGILDRLDGRASAVGAVNTIYRGQGEELKGTNTDVDGVADALAPVDLQGADVCVIGAGGAARAAFHYLSDKRCAGLIMARNPEKALSVARECGLDAVGVPLRPESTALCEARVLINATQLGMTGQDAMPDFILEELEGLAKDALVFDMVYAPLETALLQAAKSRGRRTADGLTMLIGQAASAFEKFFGKPAPREFDGQLRERLTA
jgi:shikimate dehydrogenase